MIDNFSTVMYTILMEHKREEKGATKHVVIPFETKKERAEFEAWLKRKAMLTGRLVLGLIQQKMREDP